MNSLLKSSAGIDPPFRGGLVDRDSAHLPALKQALDDAGAHIGQAQHSAGLLATAFDAGWADDIPLVAIDRLVELGRLAASDCPPESDWFDENGLKVASEALGMLSEIVGAEFERAASAIEIATSAVQAAARWADAGGGTIGVRSLATVIGRDTTISGVVDAAEDAASHLEAFRHGPLASQTGPAMLAHELRTLAHVGNWCSTLAAACSAMAEELSTIDKLSGGSITVAQAQELLGLRAIDNALQAPPDDSGPRPAPTGPVVDTVPTDLDARPEWACDYVEPQASAPPSTTAEFHDPAFRGVIVAQVCEVVDDHSPIHRDAVLRVIRTAWGRGRAGNLMRKAFNSAVGRAVAERGIEQRGDWLHSPKGMMVVRVPASDDAPRRTIEEVPPDEIELAIMHLLEDAGASRNTDLREAWARLYGWKRVGPDIERAFDRAVRTLIRAGEVNGPDPLRLAD